MVILAAVLLSICLLIREAQSLTAEIDRSAWTATADSFQAGNEPSNVLDSNTATFWHSRYDPTLDALPNWIQMDMNATYNIHTIVYTPRQDRPNGRIGSHRIEVSVDGTIWGNPVAQGTWANDNLVKTVQFTTKPARYVRITALSEAQNTGKQWSSCAEIRVFHEAGNRGPWTTAAEINLLGGSGSAPYTPPPASKGIWTSTINLPLVAASAAMLPNGKVLLWSAYARDNYGGSRGYTQTAIFDPATGGASSRTVTNTQHDMFCPGISLDFDGRVIVTGGSNAAKTSIYDPSSDAWIPAPDMKVARGYQSTTTCTDGRIFNMGGSWSGPVGGKNGEIYTPSTNSWSLVQNALVAPMLTADKRGAYRADNHPWLFAWKGNTVFQAGPSKKMNWYDPKGDGSTTGAGLRGDDGDSMNGIAVMYDAPAGKILTAGGAANYEYDNARSNAYIITIGTPQTNPSVTKLPNMAYARGFANGVALPDGTIFVTGGQVTVIPFNDATAQLTPELFDPTTNKWTQLNPMSVPRTYHSVALLLPDATVFQSGGGLCGTCSTNHLDAQIFVPPYLLNSDGTRRTRPQIITVASTVKLGDTLVITTNNPVTRFSLIRIGSATHTVNTDQRRIPLTPSALGTTYTVTIPSDPGVALPGYWYLFAINSAGTPSVAKTIKVTP
ncbi:carbohydrate-binding module family 32 [Lentithecium fluviatile CBS 122367]|uniref:Carbohydrate-binding module family 32 n=1 Tax=Lentithecium fluviatile CBS 122367 TaxID=1168545 RepID=A0A6G1IQ69_9PLEO|nr:carbohydrate-binding module family 32 [Lentithecium fluviatile CBS 122367]